MQSLSTAKESAKTKEDDAFVSSVPCGSVAKPTGAEFSEASTTLQNMTDMLSNRKNETNVKKMLSDTATLKAWQKAASPSNEQRDAMMKLGSDWHVSQKINGKKRKPAKVAEDLQKELIATTKRLLEYKTPFGNKRGVADWCNVSTLSSLTRSRKRMLLP